MSTYVSRAGEKLCYALDQFKLDLKDLVCADFGSSTGGFVDCLLQNGAKRVYSIDTAYGQIAWKLRNDPKIVLMEKTNAMHVNLPEKMDLISIDTGWTKQAKIIPNALNNLSSTGTIISLVKPHYEAGSRKIVKGKLPNHLIDETLKKVEEEIKLTGAKSIKIIKSPIKGEKASNEEFLFLIKPCSI